jgi:glycosyltransferase involved in cell wall biosynthesis
MKKQRILYISSVTPDTSCGAHIAIYRHLVYKNNFDVTVCSYSATTSMTEEKFVIPMTKLRRRLQNTRLSQLLWNLHYALSWFLIPNELVNYAKSYNPDVIFTVPDNIHSGFALQLAKRLKKPLAIDLQDLFPQSQFIAKYMQPYGFIRKYLSKKFFFLHKQADLAFYTSEGMKEWFPQHTNGHVLYPIGDFNNHPDATTSQISDNNNGKPFTIIYAGNCYGAYGRMLLRFARLVKETPNIHLKIYPVGKGWSDKDIDIMTNAGIYQCFTPFNILKKEFEKADAFLTVMSFETQEKPFVSTSFTTKWLDYAPYGKPIFSWGPEYSSAYIFSKVHECGVTTCIDDEKALLESCLSIREDRAIREKYGKNALNAANSVLNSNNIHAIFTNELIRLVKKDQKTEEKK